MENLHKIMWLREWILSISNRDWNLLLLQEVATEVFHGHFHGIYLQSLLPHLQRGKFGKYFQIQELHPCSVFKFDLVVEGEKYYIAQNL